MSALKQVKAKILELSDIPSFLIDDHEIVVGRDFDPQQVIKMAVEQGALHIVQKNCREFDQEIQVANTMMFEPQDFLKNPLAAILGQKQTSELRVDCLAHDHKKVPLEKLEQFISGLHGSRNILHEVVASTEEIFTNASKNSGVFYKHFGNPGSSATEKYGSIRLLAGATKDTLVVGCVDSFGLLDVHSLLARVHACYDKGIAGSISMGSGGAGIGTFLVYSFAMNIYIAVEKNKQTAVFCAYPLGMRAKDFELLPKNLHLISI